MSEDGRARIRPAAVADAAAIVDVRIAAWRAAYDGLMPATFLAGMDEDRIEGAQRMAARLARASPNTVLVALADDGVPLGGGRQCPRPPLLRAARLAGRRWAPA